MKRPLSDDQSKCYAAEREVAEYGKLFGTSAWISRDTVSDPLIKDLISHISDKKTWNVKNLQLCVLKSLQDYVWYKFAIIIKILYLQTKKQDDTAKYC